jgi:hypothetical protein
MCPKANPFAFDFDTLPIAIPEKCPATISPKKTVQKDNGDRIISLLFSALVWYSEMYGFSRSFFSFLEAMP